MPTDKASETDVCDRILKHVDAMPPRQRSIAEYLLEHLDTVPFLSVPELARLTPIFMSAVAMARTPPSVAR